MIAKLSRIQDQLLRLDDLRPSEEEEEEASVDAVDSAPEEEDWFRD